MTELVKYSKIGVQDLNNGTGTFEVTLADGRVVTMDQVSLTALNALFPLSIIATGSVTSRSLALRFADITNVKDYGATGDGITDDTAAIVLAIAVGGIVFFPAGTYIVTSFSVTTSMILTGVGRTSIIKQKASTVAHMITVSGTSPRVLVQHLTIDGNTASQAAQSTNRSLYFSSTGTSTNPSSLEVSSCTFINGNYADIYALTDTVLSTLDYLTVNDCTFLGGSDGNNNANGDPRYISITRPIIYQITGCTFDFLQTSPAGWGRVGIMSFQTGVVTDYSHGTISNNVFTNCGRHTDGGTGNLATISLYSYTEAMVVSNNVMINNFGGAISSKFDAKNLTIANNTVLGVVSLHGNPNTGGCISVNASVNTTSRGIVSITGNAIADAFHDGIVIDGVDSGGTVYGVTVSITGNTLNAISATNVAISVNRLTDVTISGNAVYGFGAGVYLQNARKSAVISGNTFRGCTVYAVNIAITNTLAQLTITGNYVEDATTRGIYLGSSGGGLVVGNTVNNTGTTVGIYVLNNTVAMLIANNNVTASTPLFISGTVTGLRVLDNIFSTTITRLLTIATGAITAYLDWHTVSTEAAAATDDLDTVSGGVDGGILTLRATLSTTDVVVKDGTGNMKLAGDFTMNNLEDTITLRYMSGTWYELSRSDNGA